MNQATIEIVLSNGYRYKATTTDDQARRVLRQLLKLAKTEAA